MGSPPVRHFHRPAPASPLLFGRRAGARIRELIDRAIEKVKALVAPPPVPIPVPARPRR